MRVRTRDASHLAYTNTVWTGWIGEGVPPPPPCTGGGGFVAVCRHGMIKETRDRVTPGYFPMKRGRKPLPVNAFTSMTDTWSSGGNLPSAYRKSGSSYSLLQMCGNGLTPQKPNYWTVERPDVPWEPLLQRAWADLSTQLSWDATTTAAEIGKTFQMIATFRKNCIRRAEHLMKYIRSDGKGGRSYLELFSEAWLEYRYGWTPLYRDIIDIAEAAARCAINHEPLIRASRQDVGQSESAWTPWQRYGGNVGAANVQARYKETWTRTIRTGAGMIATTGASVQVDPVQTAWEVIPWSFVIDWFVGIGDTLATVSPYLNRKPQFLWVTEHDVRTRSMQYRWEWGEESLVNSFFEESTKVRFVPTHVPTGVYLKFNLNMKKYVDAAALLKIASKIRLR